MIAKLVIGNIIGNRKKTIISIICICFSVMLIFVSINTYVSFQKMRIENAYDAYGKYNMVLHEVDGDICNWVNENYEEDAQIGIEKIIGVTASGITLVNCDDNTIEMNKYKLVEGNLPVQKDEVAISSTAKYDGDYIINKYSVGDRIELNSCNYTISGIIDDYDYSTVDTYKIAVITDGTNTNIFNVYLHFNDKQTYMRAYEEIKTRLNLDEDRIFDGEKNNGFLGSYTLILNSELNKIEIEGEGSLQDINIGSLLICFIIILIVTSLILGIHIFLSYLNARNRQQGILMSLGFSNYYISSIYFIECFILALLGCALGIFLGRYLTELLFQCIQTMRVTRLDNFEPQFTKSSILIVLLISLIVFIVGILPVITRTVHMSIVDVIKGKNNRYKNSRKKTREYQTRFVTIKYFLRDNYPYEKICIYLAMILIGMVFMLLLLVNKYVNYVLEHKDKYDTEFELLPDDISSMEGFQNLIPEIAYYDLIYDTTGEFYIDRDNINEQYADNLVYGEDNTVYCEIVGVSELQFKNKIELSAEMTYDEFVQSNSAIIIDNYVGEEALILKSLPDSIEYAERNDDMGACFEAGEIKILCRSKFINWEDQRGISIVVPEELFKEKFDYTNVLIKINVKSGYEIEAAEILNKYSYLYHYTFLDHASEYIKEQDDSTTIRISTYGVLMFVTIINLFTILYINVLIYIRRRKNISILKVMGHSNLNIIIPMIFEVIIESLAATIISAFVITVLTKRFLPITTQNIILTDGLKNMLSIFAFILFIQTISLIVIFVRLTKQKVIHDLGL